MVGFPNGPFPFAKCFANFRGGHSISSPEIRLFVRAYLTIGFPIGGVGWAAIKTWPHLKFFFVQCGPHLGYCCSPETTSQTKKNVNSWVPKKIWQTLNPPPSRNIIQFSEYHPAQGDREQLYATPEPKAFGKGGVSRGPPCGNHRVIKDSLLEI